MSLRSPIKFCPICGASFPAEAQNGKSCVAPGCGFVFYNNPVPVVAAIVEQKDGVVFAHNKSWPDGVFGPITGFLERGETPDKAILRELKEELGLCGDPPQLIGQYAFADQNQLILAYHIRADGSITLGDELDAFKIIPIDKLKAWPFGTGPAVRDWLAERRGHHAYKT